MGCFKDGIKLFNFLLKECEEERNLGQSKVMEDILQGKWNADPKDHLRVTGRYILDDNYSESEEDVEPLIVTFQK